MFDTDKWQEILNSISKNKLRTFLTGFSVAWGIFMLIILLGSGKGLENGVEEQFAGDAVNSIWISGEQTSKPYKGLQPGRNIQLTNEDYENIRTGVDGVEYITTALDVRNVSTVAYKKENGLFTIRACKPEHIKLENAVVIAGRFINKPDIDEFKKVAVIGELVKDALFNNEDPIGKDLSINGISFKIVGVFRDDGGENDVRRIYIPVSTAQRCYNYKNYINTIWLSTGDAGLEKSSEMVEVIRKKLALSHNYDAGDLQATYIGNNMEEYVKVMNVLDGIRIFIWVVGIGTIIAGIVGVSNIMMIVVKDRTREIGIRKTLGATPWSIVSLILQESILITGVSGYIGLIAGVGLLEFAAGLIPESDFFKNPQVDFKLAVMATVLLVVSGAVAGFIPARKAASIEPIVALRDQ